MIEADSRKDLRPNAIVRSPLFPEPVQVILTLPVGNDLKLIGTGLTSGRTYQPILSAANLPRFRFRRSASLLTVTPVASAWASKPCAWDWPTNTTPISPS